MKKFLKALRESKTERTFSVPFEVLHETHDKETFQREGHWVPALRERDANGLLTPKEREWKGATVHAMTLLGSDGKPVMFADPSTSKNDSMCRVVSDSLEDAERLMEDCIRDAFFANKRSLEVLGDTFQQLRKASEERTNLMNWMLSNGHRDDVANVLGIATAAIEDFQRANADPKIKKAVEMMKNGEAPL